VFKDLVRSSFAAGCGNINGALPGVIALMLRGVGGYDLRFQLPTAEEMSALADWRRFVQMIG
jgi:hypothetical protein